MEIVVRAETGGILGRIIRDSNGAFRAILAGGKSFCTFRTVSAAHRWILATA